MSMPAPPPMEDSTKKVSGEEEPSRDFYTHLIQMKIKRTTMRYLSLNAYEVS